MALIRALSGSSGGGGAKQQSGSFTSVANTTLTISASELTNIYAVEWKFRDYPTQHGVSALSSDGDFAHSYVYSGTIRGVDGISGNTFTFTWNGVVVVDWVAYDLGIS